MRRASTVTLSDLKAASAKCGIWRNCLGHGHGLKGKAISAAGGTVVKSECSASQKINMSALKLYFKVQ